MIVGADGATISVLFVVTRIITAVASLLALGIVDRLKAVEIAEEWHRAVAGSLPG